MTNPFFVAFLFAILGKASADGVCTTGSCSFHNVQASSLLQTKTSRDVKKTENRDGDEDTAVPGSIDGAHIVCHSEGCAEVHAKLKVLQARTATAKEKLIECGKHRAALEKGLQLAAQKRAQAEAELQECADDRKKLTAELAQCGVDRTSAEKGLAECAAQRAELEAELRQCAEVDRPTAERKLQECAVERAKLEKQLVAVVAKLKKGGASTSRRRRRNKASLAQTDAEVGTESEMDAEVGTESEMDAEVSAESEMALHAEESRLRTRLSDLAKDADDLGAQLDATDQKTEAANAAMEKVDQDEDNYAKRVLAEDSKESRLLGKFKALQKKTDGVEANLEDESGASEQVKGDLQASTQFEKDAQAELLASAAEQASAANDLLLLSLELQHLRHKEIQLIQHEQQRNITELRGKLQLQEKDDSEDCDETRAAVIAAEEKAEETSAALNECLAMKKFIQSKMDAANNAREMAEKGLEECVAKKAKLRAALEECHKRRDSARTKLQECLNRKKVLKDKITQCHKARDSASAKLAECLARKKELKTKIKAASAKMGKSSLLGTDGVSSSDVVADMKGALALLRDQNRKFGEFIKLDADHSARLGELAADIQAHSAEEGVLLAKLVTANDDEAGAQDGFNVLQENVQDVVENLNVASREGFAAASGAHASAVEADSAAGVPGPPADASPEANKDKAYDSQSKE